MTYLGAFQHNHAAALDQGHDGNEGKKAAQDQVLDLFPYCLWHGLGLIRLNAEGQAGRPATKNVD